ncbi:proteasome maturation factor UMP1-domain-containing protein [Xylariaceae sp. FL0804]|nr:proteasome maturation factor UMP1-domain-containing protein [Xylariaceae sp. FL0804]
MSMRIVPASPHPRSFTHLRSAGAPSAPGVHDTLRHGVGPSSSSLTSSTSLTSSSTNSTTGPPPESAHPLEARLRAWEATQEALRHEQLRRAFGMAEPIRRGMELRTARQGSWRPACLGAANGIGGVGSGSGGGGGGGSLHEDVLRGRDADVAWEDVFTGEERRAAVGIHDEMERKLRI